MDDLLFEKTVSSQTIYEGRIFNVKKDEVLLSNQNKAEREFIEHSGGVCIAALDGDELYFVRQFRYPYKEVILELPAGKLSKGEDPLECAKRELLEETGVVAKQYQYVGEMYPSPGYTDEIIHLYIAYDLQQKEQNLDEDEFLEVVKIPLEKAIGMGMVGGIKDAKTQILLFKCASFYYGGALGKKKYEK